MVYVKPGEMRMIFFSVSNTGILGKRNSEFSQQESNLRPSDYQFGRSTTELQETRGIELRPLNYKLKKNFSKIVWHF